MLKTTLLTATTLLLMSGCVTKEIYYPQPTMVAQESSDSTFTIRTERLAGATLTATSAVSSLITQIEQLNNNTAYVDFEGKQNVRVGEFLNIRATPNINGYLKIVIIDPNGEKYTVLPNVKHNGYLKAHQRFYTNHEDFALKATKPTGLHYVVEIFSEYRSPLCVRQGMNGIEHHTDQQFIRLLESINNQQYGRSNIRIFPLHIY